MLLELIEIPQLIFDKDWTKPTLLARHLSLDECGFPCLKVCFDFSFCLSLKWVP